MYHYVYLLIHESTELFYIGARSSTVSPEDDPYMSSSSLGKEYCSNCDKLILQEFTTRKEAVAYEIFLHNSFDVGINPKFFNKAKQTSTKFDIAGNKEIGKKISASNKGRVPWIKGKRNPYSKETLYKIGSANRGKKLSQEQRNKMSEAHSGANNSRARVTDIYEYGTDLLLAENVCLKPWALENGYSPGVLRETAVADRTKPHKNRVNPHYHKGIYARYKD